jgi:hypothetical protein
MATVFHFAWLMQAFDTGWSPARDHHHPKAPKALFQMFADIIVPGQKI